MLISCPECNAKVSDKADVCPHCGFRIDTLVRCPDCGKLAQPGTATCPECGCPLAQATRGPSTTESEPSPPTVLQSPKPDKTTVPNTGMLSSGDADSPRWYYRDAEGRSPVPLSTNEIRRRIADGRMLSSVEVWTQGADKWKPASRYLVFSGQPSSNVVSAEVAVSQPSPVRNMSRGTKRVWYYVLKGLVYGPTSADDIYHRILDGRLPSDVSVWKQGSTDWAPATDYVFFSKEGPSVADAMAQDSQLESDALPVMLSMDGKTIYTHSQVADDTAAGTYAGIVHEPHPWIRYFARMIDIYLFANVLILVTTYFRISFVWLFSGRFFSTEEYDLVTGILLFILAPVFMIPIEGLWLCLCGTTPGKWLLGVSVRSVDGHKPSYGKALRRSGLVCLEGLMLNIPVLNIVGLALGFRTLNRTDATPWDLRASTTTQHRDLSALQTVFLVLVIAGYMCLVLLKWRKAGL